jgi:GNAT superfamily N-acetyltransferase
MITRARSQDLPLILAMSAEFNEIDGHAHDESRVRAALAPLLRGDDLGVVFLVGEPPVGYAVVTWGYSIESGGRDALVDEIYVRPRGEGIGRVALAEVLDDLRARGLSRVLLETERANSRVRAFYARHGFQEDDSIWMSLDL